MATLSHNPDMLVAPRQVSDARPGPSGDPGALAVMSFATTSFILGLYNTHMLGSGSLPIVFPFAFFYAGLIQIIVAALEARREDVFGAVVFGSYGAFWVIYGSIEVWFAKLSTASSVSSGVAAFLAMFAVVTFFFVLASLKTDVVLVAVLSLTFLGLSLLTVGAESGVAFWQRAGGWVSLAFAVLAWYHAAADIINFTFERSVLPLGKIAK